MTRTRCLAISPQWHGIARRRRSGDNTPSTCGPSGRFGRPASRSRKDCHRKCNHTLGNPSYLRESMERHRGTLFSVCRSNRRTRSQSSRGAVFLWLGSAFLPCHLRRDPVIHHPIKDFLELMLAIIRASPEWVGIMQPSQQRIGRHMEYDRQRSDEAGSEMFRPDDPDLAGPGKWIAVDFSHHLRASPRFP